MSFEKEVSKFCESDRTTVVDINSEQVLCNIVNFTLSFGMKDNNNDLFDFFDVDFIVGIEVFGEYTSEFSPEFILKCLGSSLHVLLKL